MKKKQDTPGVDYIKDKWSVSLTSSDATNEPEDYGTVFFTLPFCFRQRFAIIPLQNREPSITIYADYWDNENRCWVQKGPLAYSVGLPTLRHLMALVEEELAK